MSEKGRSTMTAGNGQQSVGELMRQGTEQLSELVRQELRLAQVEMARKGRRVRVGGELYGGAGVTGFLGLQALVAASIAAIDLALPIWASALIIAGALLLLATVLALVGRRKTRQLSSLKPEAALNMMRADVEVIKERVHR